MIRDRETLDLLLDTVRRFVRERLVPNEHRVADEDAIPHEIVAEMRELGLFGLSLPEAYGGLGLTMEEEVLVAFELAHTSPAFRSLIGTNNGIGSQGIVIDGTEAQKQRWLPRLASGEIVGSFALTEPGSGSDASSLATTARRDGDAYVLDGTKRFITNAPEAGIFTVMARTDVADKGAGGISAFVVERGTAGLSLGTPDRKMGQRGAHTCDVIFERCRVPAENLIGGREGVGFKTAMKVLDKGRLHIAAVCVGASERMLGDALRYAVERKQFGRPIAEFQLVQAMLADSRAEIYAARSMVLDAARRRDAGEDVATEAACCKLFASEMCGRVADRAVQVHGGAGYVSDYAIERFYRDVRLFRIYEGTSQIQQLVIARAMIPQRSGVSLRIDSLPRRWIAQAPAATALHFEGSPVSFAALGAAIDGCAAVLRDGGVHAGQRVMIVAENSPALVASLFATSALGATAVIANPRLSERELDGIREHAAPRCTLFATGIAAEADAHARRLASRDVDVPGAGALALALQDAEGPATEDVAAIVYTSGTSGRPKGVMLTHANLLFIAATSSRLRELRPSDRVFGALPIYHVYGLASVLLGTICAGACLVLMPRFDARRALDLVAAGEITVFQGVPAMYARMLERLPAGTRAPAGNVRYLYAGGSPLDASLKAQVEARFGLPLHNGYGLTECSPTVSQTRLATPRADTSVGPPIEGIEIRIVDATGTDTSGVGELWVRGPNVMLGYYRDADATAEVVTRDGWLRTGDLARRDADGALFIVGRSKELIIRSGLNVYPIEVETVLNAHPAVSQSVVVGRTLDDGNEEVIAFVEIAAGQTATPEALAAHAAAQLAPYKRPSEIRVLDALPASATGKVLRGRLKSMAAARGIS